MPCRPVHTTTNWISHTHATCSNHQNGGGDRCNLHTPPFDAQGHALDSVDHAIRLAKGVADHLSSVVRIPANANFDDGPMQMGAPFTGSRMVSPFKVLLAGRSRIQQKTLGFEFQLRVRVARLQNILRCFCGLNGHAERVKMAAKAIGQVMKVEHHDEETIVWGKHGGPAPLHAASRHLDRP